MDTRKLSQRKTPPLAYCEYVSADPRNSIEVWAARRELIEAVKRVFPEFLRALSDDVFPAYKKLAKAGYNLDQILWSTQVSPYEALRTRQHWTVQNGPLSRCEENGKTQADEEVDAEIASSKKSEDLSRYTELMNQKESKLRTGWSWVPRNKHVENLSSALAKWATRFNVTDEWLVDEALRTLRGWYVAPKWRKSFRWNSLHGHSGAFSTGGRFELCCGGWETELLTWSAYSQSVRKSFEDKLMEYEKKTRALAVSRGLVRARRKYSPENIDWFVLYQFAGRSSTEIAKGRYGDDSDSTVLKGIKAASTLLRWGRVRNPEARRNRKIR